MAGMDCDVLIVGGGVGGLSLALSLAARGRVPLVLERAGKLSQVGAGLQLPPNAMRVYSALGLAQTLRSLAFAPKALEARLGRSGRRIFRVGLDGGPWGEAYLHIHRADLISTLAQALEARAPGRLRLGAEVVDFDDIGEKVAVTLADGSRLEGAALIGADGLGSFVRSRLFGAETPRFTGNVAWRAVVERAALGALAPPPTACVWMGPGRHAVTYRLRDGEACNFVGVVETDNWQEEGWHHEGDRKAALEDFKGWHPTVRALIREAPVLHRWALLDRDPLDTWSRGRVGLLGDAAHPVPPFFAQGAAMAAEDAWVLARELCEGGVERAFARYSRQRQGRTARVLRESRANARTFHRANAVSQLATYGPMWVAGHVAPGLVRKRLDWLYGHDVTDAP